MKPFPTWHYWGRPWFYLGQRFQVFKKRRKISMIYLFYSAGFTIINESLMNNQGQTNTRILSSSWKEHKV